MPERSHTLRCTSCTSHCPRLSRTGPTQRITSSGTRHTLSYVMQHLTGSRPSTFHETGTRAERRDMEDGFGLPKTSQDSDEDVKVVYIVMLTLISK